jgi:hypothetical protein
MDIIPENCFSNETLMQIIEEKGLFDNSTVEAEIPIHNYSDPVSFLWRLYLKSRPFY